MTHEIPMPDSYDVVIVGGGAAGLSAALVLGRALRRVAVVDAGSPRNAPASHMHGYLSRDGLPPGELLARGREEVRRYGVALLPGIVDDLERVDGAFRVGLAGGVELRARRLLVATGLRDELPAVDGLQERFGRDVLHCPYCHGYEVRHQRVGVLGGTPGAVEHAILLRQWAADVVYFPNGDPVDDDDRERLLSRAVGVVEGPVKRVLVEDDALRSVVLADGRTVARDAVFVRPRFHANDSLLARLGCAVDEQGWVRTDATGRTSVPGVWAAGNAVNPRAQVITAAGEGSAAAIGVNGDLVDEDTALELAEFRGQQAR
jgi:thioredoxin reductase